jgi:hypothetical protein
MKRMKHMSNNKVKTPNVHLENLEETLRTIELKDIELNAILQARADMKPSTVKTYEKAYSNGTMFPPLLVAEVSDYKGDKAYLLLDGWHRRQAMINIKWEHPVDVRAIKIPKGTPIEYLIYLGGKENLRNGLPLSSKDKRELFRAYVRGRHNKIGRRYKSYREIASDLMLVTHQTLFTWMKKDFPATAQRMRLEHKEDNVTITGARGTGHELATMPDLTTKDLGSLALDIISVAKASDDEGREKIHIWLDELKIALRWEAPYKPSIQRKTSPDKVNKYTLMDDTFNKTA